MTITRGVATQCIQCAGRSAEIRVRLFAVERRRRRGLLPRQADIDRIATEKDWIRSCAEQGHHDPQAGPAATWGNR